MAKMLRRSAGIEGRTRIRTRHWLAGAAVAALVAAPSITLAASFDISLFNCAPGISIQNSPTPVSASQACSPPTGNASEAARATFGSVGTAATGSTFELNPFAAASIGGHADAGFRDTVVFTQTDPSAPAVFDISLNLVLDGILDAVLGTPTPGFETTPIGASALFRFGVSLGGAVFGSQARFAVGANKPGFEVTNPNGIIGLDGIVPGPAGFTALLVTPEFSTSVGSHSLAFAVSSETGALGTGSSAISDFLNSLEFPTGVDVFNLPPGITVNGAGLVNNRFGDTAAVPEPTTLVLLGAGVIGLLIVRRPRADLGGA